MKTAKTNTTVRNRAPKGGVTINGKFYRGGQFIPATQDDGKAAKLAELKAKAEELAKTREWVRERREACLAAYLRGAGTLGRFETWAAKAEQIGTEYYETLDAIAELAS